jgi:hypothetical protein
MTAADSLSSHSRAPVEDESHDQIGSGASTPPATGTATPRPDLHNDKRVPALPNHNYFVQVRDFSFTLPPVCFPCPRLPYPHPRTLARWPIPSRDRRSFRLSPLRLQQASRTNFASPHYSSHTKCRHPTCPHKLQCPPHLLLRILRYTWPAMRTLAAPA